ncbi:MAG: OmpH family outer membrane protein [Hyphomonadaceae bacterium]
MRFLKPLIAAVALTTAISAAPVAMAQRGGASGVMVINYQRVIEASDVGRDMTTKLGQIAQQVQGELQPEAQAIEQEQQSIQQATQGMNEEQVRRNTQLQQRVEAFAVRYNQFRQRQVTLSRDLEYTRQVTLNDFNQQITPFVREVMEQRNAGVVLDASTTQLIQPNVDATDDVVQRLNQRLRTINVTRQSAPQPQQQQQAPPQQ